MPFAARRRHQYWTADVRYIEDDHLGRQGVRHLGPGQPLPRLPRERDLPRRTCRLPLVLSAASRPTARSRRSSPTGAASSRRQARRSTSPWHRKERIEHGKPGKTTRNTFNVMRRMADRLAGRELAGVGLPTTASSRTTTPNPLGHGDRPTRAAQPGNGAGLGPRGVVREAELGAPSSPARYARALNAVGSARFRHWRVYGEEALAGWEAALWLGRGEPHPREHAGETLSRYAVEVEPETGALRSVGRPRLFETSHELRQPQHRLFALGSLGECGWLKALRLEGYAPQRLRGPLSLHQALFPAGPAPRLKRLRVGEDHSQKPDTTVCSDSEDQGSSGRTTASGLPCVSLYQPPARRASSSMQPPG